MLLGMAASAVAQESAMEKSITSLKEKIAVSEKGEN